jgi:hypothetical protein
VNTAPDSYLLSPPLQSTDLKIKEHHSFSYPILTDTGDLKAKLEMVNVIGGTPISFENH